MVQRGFSLKLIAGLTIALFFGIALYFRIALPYDGVFAGDWIKFTGVDAYYHLRLVDNLLHHFPHYIVFDPYTYFPQGAVISWPPFFDWLIAGITWLVGLGSPTQHTVDIVGAYLPAVLGALTVIPVYFIGKLLFNRWAGLISAGLIAFMPGEFLGRSILGFADHHVAETLFAAVTMLFLILAIKTARQKQLKLAHMVRRDWTVITRPLIFSLLAGLFLGSYLLTWIGGPLLIFIFFAYFITQFIIDHWRGESTDYLCITGSMFSLVALILALFLLPLTWARTPTILPLAVVTAIPLFLNGISRVMTGKNLKKGYFPLTTLGSGLVALLIFYLVSPSLFKAMLGRFEIFAPQGANLAILEVQPLLFPNGDFSFSVAWGNFTTGFFLSFISLGILIYFLARRAGSDKTLFVVWSLIMLAATLGQRRFAYYFAVNAALLTGYLSWLIIELVSIGKADANFTKAGRKARATPNGQKGTSGYAAGRVKTALALIAIFFLAFYPNIGPAISTASQGVSTPNDGWYESLSWLKDNTPEPFGSPDFYYEDYESPLPGKAYDYPESAYGILAWWDYGHWITRIAHRIPNRSPLVTGIPDIARFFIAQDEPSSYEAINKLGSRYIIIDYPTATTKFHAVTTWAGENEEGYYDIYYQRQENKLVPVVLFYPEYYRSMAIRLYNFDGNEVIPQSTTVVSYEEKTTRDGNHYKEISGLESLPGYDAASSYIASQKSNHCRIVGTDPFVSPVPLKALEHYKPIHSSVSSATEPNGDKTPSVKVFEYTG